MAPMGPRRGWARPLLPLLLPLLLAVGLIGAACGDGDSDEPAGEGVAVSALAGLGSPRPYALGFAAVPADLSEAAYLEVFERAAAEGDMIMIQRAVPWAELAPGATLQPATEATIEREGALLAEHGLALLYAIDPWEPTDRGALAGDAPGAGFADPAVVDAYLAYVDLVVERYQPRWLALAVDVDRFATARPADVASFQAAYIRAYQRVKELAPATRVFLTFQLEDLQGLLPWAAAHSPQWALVLRFRPFLDLLAFSSFPSFVFPFAGDIPAEYYSRLLAFGKPLALIPVGYASAPGRGGVTFGTAAGQQRFLGRILDEAEAARWEVVVWLAPQDPAFALAPYDLLNRMGLRDPDGLTKPAWATWLEAARRPWLALPATAFRELGAGDGAAADASRPPAGS